MNDINKKDILNELLSSLDYISCYIVGSSISSFIINKGDIDIVIITESGDRNIIPIDIRKNLRKNYNLDIHVCDKDFFTKNIHWHSTFMQHYSGEDMSSEITLPLNNIEYTKQELVKRCKKLNHERLEQFKDSVYKVKIWYHLYVILCYIHNNSYELTEKQIENINILHDRKEEDLDKRKELIDNLVKEIESWQN